MCTSFRQQEGRRYAKRVHASLTSLSHRLISFVPPPPSCLQSSSSSSSTSMSGYREKEGQRERLCGSSLFSQIDLHQRGSLRFDDFVRLCDQVFNENDDESKQFDRNEMVAIFQILDDDRDGKIDRNDFVVAATSLRGRGGAEDDEEDDDDDDDDDDDVDCGGGAFWDPPQQQQEYKEKDDERDALAWETFIGSSKRAAVAAKLRRFVAC